jgi:hypothetical protein
MLLLERGRHGHHGLDTSGPLSTLRAKAALAPQDTRADGTLSRILHTLGSSTSVAAPPFPRVCPGIPQSPDSGTAGDRRPARGADNGDPARA